MSPAGSSGCGNLENAGLRCNKKKVACFGLHGDGTSTSRVSAGPARICDPLAGREDAAVSGTVTVCACVLWLLLMNARDGVVVWPVRVGALPGGKEGSG